jgi:hypothetical protein
MSRFTDAERRAVMEESRRILSEEPPPLPEPAPVPREVRIEFEDDLDRWRREADASDRECEQNRAALRRSERETRSQERTIDRLNAEVAALRNDHNALAAAANEQARALIEFGNTVETKLVALSALADRLQRTLEDTRTARAGEVASLRSQLDLVARQNAWLDEQLRVAQHEADVAIGRRESLRTREAVQRVASIIKLK